MIFPLQELENMQIKELTYTKGNEQNLIILDS